VINLESPGVGGWRPRHDDLSLGLADDFANGIIAKRTIEFAKAGERDPDLLCERAIEQLRGHLYGD
jgi:hypothetical protein